MNDFYQSNESSQVWVLQNTVNVWDHVSHHVASNSLDGLPVLGQAAFLFGQVHVTF